MTRKQAREEVFFIVFEHSFSGGTAGDLLALAAECRELLPDKFVERSVRGTLERIPELDELIARNLKGWKLHRISRVALAILRLAVFELRWLDDVPTGATINEAVELAKVYGGEDDSAYINGVLGSIARAGEEKGQPLEQQ